MAGEITRGLGGQRPIIGPIGVADVGGLRRAGAAYAENAQSIMEGASDLEGVLRDIFKENKANSDSIFIAKVMKEERELTERDRLKYERDPSLYNTVSEQRRKIILSGAREAELTQSALAMLEVKLHNEQGSRKIEFLRAQNAIMKNQAYATAVDAVNDFENNALNDAMNNGTLGITRVLAEYELMLVTNAKAGRDGMWGEHVLSDGSTKSMAIKELMRSALINIVGTMAAKDVEAMNVGPGVKRESLIKFINTPLMGEDGIEVLDSKIRQAAGYLALSMFNTKYNTESMRRKKERLAQIRPWAEAESALRNGKKYKKLSGQAIIDMLTHTTRLELYDAGNLSRLYSALGDFNQDESNVDTLMKLDLDIEAIRKDPGSWDSKRIRERKTEMGYNYSETAMLLRARYNANMDISRAKEGRLIREKLDQIAISSVPGDYNEIDRWATTNNIKSQGVLQLYDAVARKYGTYISSANVSYVNQLMSEMRNKIGMGQYSQAQIRIDLKTYGLENNVGALRMMYGAFISATNAKANENTDLLFAIDAAKSGVIGRHTRGVQKFILNEMRFGTLLPDGTTDPIDYNRIGNPDLLSEEEFLKWRLRIRDITRSSNTIGDDLKNFVSSMFKDLGNTTRFLRGIDLYQDNTRFSGKFGMESQFDDTTRIYMNEIIAWTGLGENIPDIIERIQAKLDGKDMELGDREAAIKLAKIDPKKGDTIAKWLVTGDYGSRLERALENVRGAFLAFVESVVQEATPPIIGDLFDATPDVDDPEMLLDAVKIFGDEARDHVSAKAALEATARRLNQKWTISLFGPKGSGSYTKLSIEAQYPDPIIGGAHYARWQMARRMVGEKGYFTTQAVQGPFTADEWVDLHGPNENQDGWWLVPTRSSVGDLSRKPVYEVWFRKDGKSQVIMAGYLKYEYLPDPTDSRDALVWERMRNKFREGLQKHPLISHAIKRFGHEAFLTTRKHVADLIYWMERNVPNPLGTGSTGKTLEWINGITEEDRVPRLIKDPGEAGGA